MKLHLTVNEKMYIEVVKSKNIKNKELYWSNYFACKLVFEQFTQHKVIELHFKNLLHDTFARILLLETCFWYLQCLE